MELLLVAWCSCQASWESVTILSKSSGGGHAWMWWYHKPFFTCEM